MTQEKFIQIVKKGYTLDLVYILQMIERGEDVSFLQENGPKFSALYQSIVRKGLITAENNLTLEGKNIIEFLDKEDNILVKVKANVNDFDKWWKAYPATDTFICKNRKFPGTRALRTKKDDCKNKLNKILLEGDYTIDQLIKALEIEVQQKVENSYKTGQNKLSYMQNSLTYLNQRTFEPFIGLIGEAEEEPSSETYI